MKLEDIVCLDFRKEENKRIIQKALRKIKPFEGIDLDEEVPIEKLEKFVFFVCKKYSVRVQYMFFPSFSKYSDVMTYTLSVKRDDNHDWICSVKAVTIYEVFAKVCLVLYYMAKKKKVPERE